MKNTISSQMFRPALFEMITVFFLLGGCMNGSDLIEEIESLPKPSNFEQVTIDSIVERHLEKGITRENTSSTFRRHGFSVSYQEKNKTDPDFANCDDSILVAVFEFKNTLSPVASYKIVVYVGFENNYSSVVKGFYIKNMF